MKEIFPASGIAGVQIVNKGNVSFLISSEPNRKNIEVEIPEGIKGIAKCDGGNFIVTTIGPREEPFSMAGFNQKGQTVRGTQTNIAGNCGPVFSGNFPQGIVIADRGGVSCGGDMNGNIISTGNRKVNGQIVIRVPSGLSLKAKSNSGTLTFASYLGDLDLEVTDGKIEAINCGGNIALKLRRQVNVDISMSRVGKLKIDADGNGQVDIDCTVGDLSVDTQGVDVTVKNATGNITHNVRNATLMVVDKKVCVSK